VLWGVEGEGRNKKREGEVGEVKVRVERGKKKGGGGGSREELMGREVGRIKGR